MKIATKMKKNIRNKRSSVYSSVSANYIRYYAQKHGEQIYDFMNAHDIGHSVYGVIMDKAATGKHVIAHRLYGHHLIYDFPLNDPQNIPSFMDHLFSDLFTRQGLPIAPGELLEETELLKYCDSIKRSWNFVNGFDVLSGTIAIYQGLEDIDKYFVEGMPISDFEDVANTLGVGALELAIAISSANPFLLIGGALRITAGLKGVFNERARYYFRVLNDRLSIEFASSEYDIVKLNRKLSRKHANMALNPHQQNKQLSIKEQNGKLGF